jgi:hypothetical protein
VASRLKGGIFRKSAIILEKIEEYKAVLGQFAQPRLNYVEWQPTEDNNVHVTNETADLYRYGNMTRQVEFLFECVKDTVDTALLEEILYLERYDDVWNYALSSAEVFII